MALPNISQAPQTPIATQSAGVNPNSVTKQNNQSQKIEEILRSIEARLGNVTNMRTTIQGATYNAFGNNFITRGATQAADMLMDSIESIFAKKEEKKEDPLAKSLKEIGVALSNLANKQGTGDDKLVNLIDLNTKKLDEVKVVLASRFEKLSNDNKAFYEQNITLLEEHKKTADRHIALLEKLSSKKPRVKKSSNKPKDITPEIEVLDDTNVFVKSETVKEKTDTSEKVNNVKETTREEKLLAAIVDMNKTMKAMYANQPLSTQETDLEKHRKTDTVTDIIPGQKNGPPFTEKMKRVGRGMFDLDANILGFTKVAAAVVAGLSAVVTFFVGAPMKAFIRVLETLVKMSSLFKNIPTPKTPPVPSGRPVPPTAPTPQTPPVPSGRPVPPTAPTPQTPPVPDKGGKLGKLGNLSKNAARIGMRAAIPVAIFSAIASTIGNIADVVATDAGMGGKKVDEALDSSNWEKMSAIQKAESGIARGIEKFTDFFGASNIANDLRADRIKKETDYLAGHMDSIEQRQRELELETRRHLNRAEAASKTTNTVVNSATYVPMRMPVKNTDEAFNRYLSSVIC